MMRQLQLFQNNEYESEKDHYIQLESISNNQIKAIEEKLLPTNAEFDEDRRLFIKCNESVDLNACAGSGKTTTLVAKLMLLEQFLPLKNNDGICILTHTNIAIDLIKEKLGSKSPLLLYPNFVGTIQSFIDQFLGIPSYIWKFKKRPEIIDEDIRSSKCINRFYELKTEEQKDLRVIANKKGVEVKELVARIIYDFSKKCFYDYQKNTKALSKDKKTDRYKKLQNIIYDVIESGYLSFMDINYLANYFLDSFKEIPELLSERFKYVFIDEMQDTNQIQAEILEQIFPPDKTIIQRIGDTNQAIYDNDTSQNWVWTPRGTVDKKCPLTLKTSIRLSEEIASNVKNICVSPIEDMSGIISTSIKPMLLLFDTSKKNEVIEKYIAILESKRKYLNLNINSKIRVIGWVGKDRTDNDESTEKYSIMSYYKAFEKKSKVKRYFETLQEYFDFNYKKFVETSNTCDLLNGILETYAKVLRDLKIDIKTRDGNKGATSTRLINLIKEQEESIRDNIFSELFLIIEDIIERKDFLELLNSTFINSIYPLIDGIGLHTSPKISFDELKIKEMFPVTENRINICGCIKLDTDTELPIVVSTVHGVKGETHVSTLYLETYFRGDDIKDLKEFILGEERKAVGVQMEKKLRTVYVGLTRASHLLCIASKKENFLPNEIEKLRESWEIVEIN